MKEIAKFCIGAFTLLCLISIMYVLIFGFSLKIETTTSTTWLLVFWFVCFIAFLIAFLILIDNRANINRKLSIYEDFFKYLFGEDVKGKITGDYFKSYRFGSMLFGGLQVDSEFLYNGQVMFPEPTRELENLVEKLRREHKIKFADNNGVDKIIVLDVRCNSKSKQSDGKWFTVIVKYLDINTVYHRVTFEIFPLDSCDELHYGMF